LTCANALSCVTRIDPVAVRHTHSRPQVTGNCHLFFALNSYETIHRQIACRLIIGGPIGIRLHGTKRPVVLRLVTPSILPVLLGCSFAGFWISLAQTTDAPLLQFEVASVKPAAPGVRKGSMRGGPGSDDPGQITIVSYPLQRLVLYAYNLRDDQLKAPEWMQSEMYDIAAKVPPGATPAQARTMLANLLRARLRLTVHHETADRTVYDLTVAPGGPKMKVSVSIRPEHVGAVFAPPNLQRGADGFPELPADYVLKLGVVTIRNSDHAKTVAIVESMSSFAEHLTRHIRQPVFDKTGLTGTYDFQFIWDPDAPASASFEKALGLKLERHKAPVDTLVIDRAEKKPVENN
jgi:uncharacterized protein (TIGR03435 family)